MKSKQLLTLHLTDKTAGMLILGIVEQCMGRIKIILLLTPDNIRSSRAIKLNRFYKEW